MYSFYNPTSKYFISTNTKVLSSTLKIQRNLVRASKKSEYLNMILKRIWPNLSQKHYMIVRDPYSRVESFFKEKLRLRVAQVDLKERPYELKLHQQIFYQFAGIKDLDSIDQKRNKLLAFTWDQYIQALPLVYLKDGHLTPQSFGLSPVIRGVFRLPYKIDRTFKIEQDADMVFLRDELNIDVSISKNKSPENAEVKWSRSAIEQVNKLYQKDFDLFGYDRR